MLITDLFSIDNIFLIGLANHLWQSTLFAIAAWLIILFLKKNRARIRYWIWFSVSIKFLIPFSIIVNLGSLISPEWMKAPVKVSPEWNVIETINKPFTPPIIESNSPVSDISGASSPSDKIPAIIFAIWLCGSLTLLFNWHKQGMRATKIARNAEPLKDKNRFDIFYQIKQKNRIPETVQIASTRDMMEPGVFGIFRPVLFLPEGISKHINDAELEAILIHEFEHIRCKDNLVAFIHMIVQALFWFHPIIWLTGAKLVFERELACDEAVLRSVKNPLVYAEGILKVCEFYLESPITCVSGVIGSNIKKRMEGIMKNQIGHKLSLVKRLFLSAAGLSILCIPLLIGVINALPGKAYSSDIDPDKMYVDEQRLDTYQGSGNSESINTQYEIINEENNKNVSGNSMSVRGQKNNQKKDAVFETNRTGTLMVASDKEMRPLPESFKTTLKTDKRSDTIVLAQNGSHEKASSDSSSFISKGISSLKNGQVEDAITHFSKAIDIDPKKALTYVARGSAYFRLGKLDNAIADYNKAIEIDPGLAAAYQNRGSVYYRKGQLDNAISDYNRAIAIDPGLTVAYEDRGNIYQEQGRFDESISDFSKVLEMSPRDALIYFFRGNAYYKKNQVDNAISDYSKAVELNPSFAIAYQNRGTAYHFKNKYKKAISDYDRAIELIPDNSLPYASRGNAYFMLNQLDNASADYNKAIELDPEMGKAQDAKKIECRRIAFLGSNLKEKICLTKTQWAVSMKFNRPNNKSITQEEMEYFNITLLGRN